MSKFSNADVEIYLGLTHQYWSVCPILNAAASYVATLSSTTNATADETRLVLEYLGTLPLPGEQLWPQPVDALAHVRKLQASRWN